MSRPRRVGHRLVSRLTETGAGVQFLAPSGKNITQVVHERAFDSQVADLTPLPADVLRATLN